MNGTFMNYVDIFQLLCLPHSARHPITGGVAVRPLLHPHPELRIVAAGGLKGPWCPVCGVPHVSHHGRMLPNMTHPHERGGRFWCLFHCHCRALQTAAMPLRVECRHEWSPSGLSPPPPSLTFLVAYATRHAHRFPQSIFVSSPS